MHHYHTEKQINYPMRIRDENGYVRSKYIAGLVPLSEKHKGRITLVVGLWNVFLKESG